MKTKLYLFMTVKGGLDEKSNLSAYCEMKVMSGRFTPLRENAQTGRKSPPMEKKSTIAVSSAILLVSTVRIQIIVMIWWFWTEIARIFPGSMLRSSRAPSALVVIKGSVWTEAGVDSW